MNKFLTQAKEYAISKGGQCLSTEYISAKKPLTWKCNNEAHKSWDTLAYLVIKKGSWCPECRDDKSKDSNGEKFLKKSQEYAKKQNGTLISTEFITAKTKMEWKCHQEHHKSFFSSMDHCVNRNRWCPECSINRPTWSTNKEIALQIAKDNGGIVIFPEGVELIKTSTILALKCSNIDHKIWKTSWRNICELKTWCPDCAGRFTPEEFVEKAHQFAKENNGICLTNSYEDQNSRFKFKCSDSSHNEFDGTYSMVQTNVWCKECKKTSEPVLQYKASKLQEANAHAKSRGGKCLSAEFTKTDENLTWECHKGHTWNAKFSNVTGTLQRWCPECAGQLSPEKLFKKAQEYAKKNNGTVLSTDIQLAKDKVEWKCSEALHSSWKISLSSIIFQNTWCPECGYENYYMENNFRVILGEMLGFPLEKSRPRWNINPRTKHLLELDGYNEEHKIAFEFQGRYHFQKIFKKQNLENIQFKDKQKINNCKQNGVTLIVIEENRKMSDIKFCVDFLESYLPTISIIFKPITNIDDLENKISQLTRTKEKERRFKLACEKAIEKDGECLSSSYINSKNRMKWKCKEKSHQPWLATYYSIFRGSWCPECAHKKPKFLD